MREDVYKTIELVGTSKTDMEGAIQNAVSRASETLRGLKWFEVTQIRGHLEGDSVRLWQVALKISFPVGEEAAVKETPPAAGKKEPAAESGAKYKCTVCGYVYDPAAGDPDGGIPPGTPFEKLPDGWRCPVCGVSKDKFEVMR